MKPVLTGRWAETPSSQRREPTLLEISSGFACDPAGLLALLNELQYRDTDAQKEIANVIGAAGITLAEADQSQLLKAIRRLSSSATNFQAFTSSGTFTVPAANRADGLTDIIVEGWSGGGAAGSTGNSGAGSNPGGGGGSGGYGLKRVLGLTPGSTITVTVGAGGVAAAAANGGAGGTTSFGAHMSITGGGGGAYGNGVLVSSGTGGVATGADLAIPGQSGGFSGSGAAPTSNDLYRVYGRGGTPPLGYGSVPLGGSGSAGLGFAAGGTTSTGSPDFAGGAGAPGLVIVQW